MISSMERVVVTSGVFDLFHVGHLRFLKKAKDLGDYLLVGISTGELVEQYKGARPIIPYEQRKEVVYGCKYVDEVFRNKVTFQLEEFKERKGVVYAVGADWKKREDCENLNWLKDSGRVRFLDYTKDVSLLCVKERVLVDFFRLLRKYTSALYEEEVKRW